MVKSEKLQVYISKSQESRLEEVSTELGLNKSEIGRRGLLRELKTLEDDLQ